MKDRQIVLSGRLRMLSEMVTPGNSVADVGCDHAFLSIYLVQKGISPRVLAMDVRPGPLGAAREHIEGCGLGAYIETRLSDGMEKLGTGEAETLVCAGMGGRLMQRILETHMEKARCLKELILQPQSELKEFRLFLRREGFRILAEDAAYEEGKYYFAMRAVYEEKNGGVPTPCEAGLQGVFDGYGELLLKGRHPVLKRYLLYRKQVAGQILEKLEAERTERAAERQAEVRQELAEIETALEWFWKGKV